MNVRQMRVGTVRFYDYLVRDDIVPTSGSKFLCGPHFSNGLLTPAALRDKVAAVCESAAS